MIIYRIVQIYAMYDCLYMLKDYVDWLLYVDLDECIFTFNAHLDTPLIESDVIPMQGENFSMLLLLFILCSLIYSTDDIVATFPNLEDDGLIMENIIFPPPCQQNQSAFWLDFTARHDQTFGTDYRNKFFAKTRYRHSLLSFILTDDAVVWKVFLFIGLFVITIKAELSYHRVSNSEKRKPKIELLVFLINIEKSPW